MEPLKEMFNKSFYQHLADALAKNYKEFGVVEFMKDVLAGNDSRSLNERMRHTTVTLKNFQGHRSMMHSLI